MARIKIDAETDDDRVGSGAWRSWFDRSDISEAVRTLTGWKQKHLEYWQSETDRLLAERSKTERVEEQAITGGVNKVVRYDPGLDTLYQTARTKRDKYDEELRRLRLWAKFLIGVTDARLEVSREDITYFFEEEKPLPVAEPVLA